MSLRRSKMVSFRLSPEEYRRLDEIRAARNMQSISDLARTAMQAMAADIAGQDPLFYELRDLRQQIQSLSQELDRLSGMVNARKGSPEE